MIINQKTQLAISVEKIDDDTVRMKQSGGPTHNFIDIDISSLNSLIEALQSHAPASIKSPQARTAKARNDQRMKDIERLSGL